MTRSLVIVHPGALGDVLLAVPAILRLRVRYPGRDTLLIARGSISRFLEVSGIVHAWMSWEGPAGAGLFSWGIPLPRELETWLERCDVAVAWMEESQGVLRARFQEFNIAEIRIQSPSASALRTRHQSHRFLEAVEELAVDEVSGRIVEVPPHVVEEGRAYLERMGAPCGQPFVLVHPGSGSAHKCLSPETIGRIIDRLAQKGLVPIVIEGPADQNAVGRILDVSSRRPLILRNLALTVLAGVLVQTRFFLGHDSGVTHLAALLGVRTVAVFGPTDPDRWAPLGDHVTIVRGPPCLCRSWEAVRQCYEKPCLGVSADQILTSLEVSGLV